MGAEEEVFWAVSASWGAGVFRISVVPEERDSLIERGDDQIRSFTTYDGRSRIPRAARNLHAIRHDAVVELDRIADRHVVPQDRARHARRRCDAHPFTAGPRLAAFLGGDADVGVDV